jgi:hypothetical protein
MRGAEANICCRQVSDAIPIPGVLEALRPAATQLQQQLEGEASSAVDTLPLCKGSSGSLVDEYTAVSLDPVAEQVRTVLQEVSGENRALFAFRVCLYLGFIWGLAQAAGDWSRRDGSTAGLSAVSLRWLVGG